MPILWRYLLVEYLRIFSLSLLSFISVLLVSRFKEIAKFAALSWSLKKTCLFISFQIPLILPIAIPISALIGSILLWKQLSKSFELTAFRASGLSLASLIGPLLFTSILLSSANFAISANLSPFCRRASKEFLYYETSSNPLVLLQRQNLVKMKTSYIKMDIEEQGKIAKDVILVTHNQSNQRLSLIFAEKLRMTDSELEGEKVAIITHLQSDQEDMFDPLIVENEETMSTNGSDLSSSLKKNRPRIDPSSLEWPMLRLHTTEVGKTGKKSWVEMLRRSSLSLSVFSFTFLGCAFGMEIGRRPAKRHLFIAITLSLILMTSYLLGKEFKSAPWIAFLIFFLPHPIIWGSSILRLSNISRGR
jgi:lipopolysaccharide export system permease protein